MELPFNHQSRNDYTHYIKPQLNNSSFLCQNTVFYSKWIAVATRSKDALWMCWCMLDKPTYACCQCAKGLWLSQNICDIDFTHSHIITATHWLAPLCLCSWIFIVSNGALRLRVQTLYRWVGEHARTVLHFNPASGGPTCRHPAAIFHIYYFLMYSHEIWT